MPVFSYLAFDKANNRKIQGEIESSTPGNLRSELQEKGLFVIRIEEKRVGGMGGQFKFFQRAPGFGAMVTFYKSLMLSVKAGVSMSQVFESLADMAPSPYMKEVLKDVNVGIGKGQSLSECFRKYPKIFVDQFCSMIEAGEASGKLAEVLEDYVTYMEDQKKLRGEIVGALVYPVIIILIAIAAVLILTLHIFPTFMKAIGLPPDKMPWITQMVMLFSDTVLNHYGKIFGGGFLVGFLAFQFFTKVRIGIRMKDWLQLNTPLAGELFKKLNLATFCRIMSLQSKSGVASIPALELTSRAISNSYYKDLILEIMETIKRGGTYMDAMGKQPKLITPLVTLLVSVGEQTGTFDEVLDTIATYYNDDVKNTVKGLTSMIEPLMIVGMGMIVGIIASSMFLPLFDLVNTMG